MTVFSNDDAGYLDWCAAHPNGYIVNSGNPPNSTYLQMHRTGCYHMRNLYGNAEHHTGGYQKTCFDTLADADNWAQSTFRVTPSRSCYCMS